MCKPNDFPQVCTPLAKEAMVEFSDLLDYIWKTPEFIEGQIEIERQKLDDYFPTFDNADSDPYVALRAFRCEHESHKLTVVFPSLMATGNLFAAVSLLEAYFLRLCQVLETQTSQQLANFRGSGLSRLIGYLKYAGLNPHNVHEWQQVDAALKIRNCLMHANGLLSWSRDATTLRTIVNSALYVPKEVRIRRKEGGKPSDEVVIVNSSLGDKLLITNDYAYEAAAQMRNFFCNLASM
jgi:hypothetical protein